MAAAKCSSLVPCCDLLSDPCGRHVSVLGRTVIVRTDICIHEHGLQCDVIRQADGIELAPGIYSIPSGEEVQEEGFCFTCHQVTLDATVLLHTQFGRMRCLPDAEYRMWRAAGLCQVAPLLLLLDDVTWRVIASEDVTIEGDSDLCIKADDKLDAAFLAYLHAHRKGGKLLEQVQTAATRGQQDLQDHRLFLFKIFFLVGIPPTLSHDLTKTPLINFCLGRCFHGDDLDLVKGEVSFEVCMGLVRLLHLEVENHHPEHGPRPALLLRDMYLDRVSRGVQKSHGWNQAAWHIPDRYAPKEYVEDFRLLEERYSKVTLEDPGDIEVPSTLPGAALSLAWDELVARDGRKREQPHTQGGPAE